MARTNTQQSELEQELENERAAYSRSMVEFQEKLSSITRSNLSLTQEVSRLHGRIDELEGELRSNSEMHTSLLERMRMEW